MLIKDIIENRRSRGRGKQCKQLRDSRDDQGEEKRALDTARDDSRIHGSKQERWSSDGNLDAQDGARHGDGTLDTASVLGSCEGGQDTGDVAGRSDRGEDARDVMNRGRMQNPSRSST